MSNMLYIIASRICKVHVIDISKAQRYYAGADPDRGESGLSHGQIFST